MPDAGASGPICHVSVADGRWPDLLPDPEGVVKQAVVTTLVCAPPLVRLPAGAGCEVSVELTDDASVQRLNSQWRGRDRPTNVLSFPQWDDGDFAAGHPHPPGLPVPLGDVVLALETCAAEAGAADRPLAAHVCHLVAHGVLHLLGHDHQDPDAATAMEALERRILAALGHPDPYAGTELACDSAATGPAETDDR